MFDDLVSQQKCFAFKSKNNQGIIYPVQPLTQFTCQAGLLKGQSYICVSYSNLQDTVDVQKPDKFCIQTGCLCPVLRHLLVRSAHKTDAAILDSIQYN